ncbi:MAG: RagB/SusD family nutrient uptake outer membrane protein [Bacteroidia bacterium]|nr:RagB/SusD family nutrient uptake outer membrane protein [Bacteroidia bacterium]
MQRNKIKYLLSTAIIATLLALVGCSEKVIDKRSQINYALNYCLPALSTENADTLFLRAYNNFSVTCNDPTMLSIVTEECNIRHTTTDNTAFIRQLFTLNELPTDNAICAWDDARISDICLNIQPPQDYNLKNAEGMYLRLMCGILICNKYLSLNANDSISKLAEVRFLRALNYYYLLDLFGEAPIFKSFTKDETVVSTSLELYDFIEDELRNILPSLPEGKLTSDFDAEYGHANKIAAHMLLARLYLNAKTYIGKTEWKQAAKEAKAVIDGPYKLSDTPLANRTMNTTFSGYQLLFTADNGSNGANSEVIFPIRFDTKMHSDMGGTTYLVCGATSDDTQYLPKVKGLGVNGSWRGNRARPNLITKFLPDSTPTDAYHTTMTKWAEDDRALFNSKNRHLKCLRRSDFEDGFTVVKFANFFTARLIPITSDPIASVDFPLMRLAEAYLTLAEAQWRMGNIDEALKSINIIRERAHAKPMTKIDSAGHAILDEWAREFYFEGRRRTDLIRFDCFGGNNNYQWQWKGGIILGQDFDAKLNRYDLPIDSLIMVSPKVNKSLMYYMIGKGIGDNSWNTEGGDNIGKGIAPMCMADESKLHFSDWFPADAEFKMFRNFDSWEEQFGAGDYAGEVAHNNSSSKNFTIPKAGIYRITLIPSESKVNIKPIPSSEVESHETLFLWANHGRQVMRRYSKSENTHIWYTDFEAQGGEVVLNITKTSSPSKAPIDLRNCLLYGIKSNIDNRGHIILHTEAVKQRIRVIYNDIDNSLFSYKLEDYITPENEIPRDIKLKIDLDNTYRSDANAYALRYSFGLPEGAQVRNIRIGLTSAKENNFGIEVCKIDNKDSNQEGTTIVYQDRIHNIMNQLGDIVTFKFSISVEFTLYGDIWSATSYSSTFYD